MGPTGIDPTCGHFSGFKEGTSLMKSADIESIIKEYRECAVTKI